jgi:type III pantothenate kinase
VAIISICFDFGNTRRKFAIFHGSELRDSGVLEGDDPDSMGRLLDQYRPDRSILSSVITHNQELENVLATRTRFHKLSHLTRLPFTTPVGRPETIGADRLALVAAAVRRFPNTNTLVIALGTCITYNFTNKYHEFIGGGISPGMDMRFKSLQAFTAALPLVKEDWNFPLIGYDTRTNILSGVILGMAKEIDGFVDAYLERYGNFNVLLTGGNTSYFVPHLRNRIFADPDLLFKGLHAILEGNDQP